MEGVATYSGTTLTMTVDLVGNSGTYSDWLFSIAGTKGAVGATGATGPQGIPGPPGATGSGAGNVTGPASSVNDRIAVYNGTSGTIIKDGGKTIAELGAGTIIVNDTPPVGSPVGTLWWESDTGNLYILYNDGSSTQWVMAVPATSAASIGAVAYTPQTASVAEKTVARQNIGSFANSYTTMGTGTLGDAQAGKATVNSAAGQTHTLPSAAAFANQTFISVNIQSGAALTVAVSGSDVIYGPAGWGITSIALPALGDFVALMSSGAFWFVVGGSAAVIGRPNLTPITAALGANVALNATGSSFVGPQIAQGSTGTWFVSGQVTLQSGGLANMFATLWDGTTIVSSAAWVCPAASHFNTLHLSGYITNPAGNLRISCRDATLTSGLILANASGGGKDSMITAMRIG
jgi:hypothetical protein